MTTENSPFALSDELVDALAALRPSQATFWGVPGHDHRWDDFSPEGVAHAEATLRAWRDRVAALPPQSDRWARLAVHVMLDALDLDLASIAHGDPYVDLNNIASTFQQTRMVFDSMDASTSQGWSNIASRLSSLPAALEGYRRTLAEGLARGTLVAARQVRAVVTQARVHAGDASGFRKMPAAVVGDEALRAQVGAAVPGVCAAYAAFADWLEGEYLPRAPETDGVGRARYLREMRRFLGSTPDPEETYAWGWQEVRRIRADMERLAAKITLSGRPDVDEALDELKRDTRRSASDRAGFIASMLHRQQRALAELDGVHFDVPAPIRRIEVKEAPPGGPIGAYYVPPSEDFSRPGTVWYSLHGDGPFPLYDEVSTAYHEGFPGHHLQCALQVSFTRNLCRMHRVAYGYSGYAEGWALYAEQLMQELGYYEKPDYEFGMLANQMMRACRVVIDIGAHVGLAIPDDAPFHPGEAWHFDTAVAMMERYGGMPHAHAVSEVTRYFGWPAQAISYKVGQRAILALRDEFLAGGGALKDFHARVLGCGNVGLDLLRAQVLT